MSLQSPPSHEKNQFSLKSGPLSHDDVENAESREVFQTGVDGVKFGIVGWPRATIVFCKINFAMSILAIPEALATLGSAGGSRALVGFTLNVYTGLILDDFHNRHPECHMLADMMGLLSGKIGRELVGVQIIAQVLISAGGIVTTAVGLYTLSNHSQCTVVFALVAAILITAYSSIRTFSNLSWLTWFGMITFTAGVFIFTIAVKQQDRPAAAPLTGDVHLGWNVIAYPGFVVGMVSALKLFICTSGSSIFLPVISEMRRPQDFRKACLAAGFIVGTLYLILSLFIYRYCGKLLSVPAFGNAGPLFKKISYGISLPGMIVGLGIYQHVAPKYVFARILRDSDHLQKNTFIHWGTWLGINLLLGSAAFIMAESVPILNYLLGLADLAPHHKAQYGGHILVVLLGLFMVVGTAYAVAEAIKQAFASGMTARVFDCADNSGST